MRTKLANKGAWLYRTTKMGGKLSNFAALLVIFVIHGNYAQEDRPSYQWDEHGYVLYCPCMGRFGNQASHFLGALAFAKQLNRTLTLPPWRSYVRQRNVPFTEWFQLAPVQSYHKSLPLEDFLSQLAPEKWPPGNRTGYCYRALDPSSNDCAMKSGNPFGPFWDELGVNFDFSEFTGLGYDVNYDFALKQWQTRYPPTEHPVLAFKGAPARFPVIREHRSLHQYLKWSKNMNQQAEDYITTQLQGQPYISVHLRMGSDWVRACEHAVGNRDFMESSQCLEDLPSAATVTQELCLPTRGTVVRHISSVARRSGIRNVFVASDSDPDVPHLQQELGTSVKVFYLNPADPQLDLVLMGKANIFIGNCVSSFSAFVKRERDANQLPSEFFGLDDLISNIGKRTEL